MYGYKQDVFVSLLGTKSKFLRVEYSPRLFSTKFSRFPIAIGNLENFVENNLGEYSTLRNFDFVPNKLTNTSCL